MIGTFCYFLAAILLLVIIHEYGHFWMARRCGVKVLRFSFGFGRILAAYHDKQGTAYTWSLWPLGGYVKMLDTTEATVPPEQMPFAFDKQPIWKRFLIVLAGPLANVLLAFCLFWIVLVVGVEGLKPIVGDVAQNSPAAEAGVLADDHIVAVNNFKVYQWQDLQYALMPLLNHPATLTLTVQSTGDKTLHDRVLVVPITVMETAKKTPLRALGMTLFIPPIVPEIGDITRGGPASKAGFKVGDRIIAINDTPLDDWMTLLNFVKAHPDKPVQFTVLRDGQKQPITATLGHQSNDGTQEGLLGVTSKKMDWPSKWVSVHRESPIQSLKMAAMQTYDVSATLLSLVGRLVVGAANTQQLSGPVGIASAAGHAGREGITAYLSFLAMVSLSLAVLNILPVPLLDGGHMLFLLMEAIKGSPVSFRTRGIFSTAGLFLLVFLMLFALFNDVSRLTGL